MGGALDVPKREILRRVQPVDPGVPLINTTSHQYRARQHDLTETDIHMRQGTTIGVHLSGPRAIQREWDRREGRREGGM